MTIYLTTAKFQGLTVIPDEFVTDLETIKPGWVQAQLDLQARWIDARLRKRYATPFAAHDATPPTPATIQDWLTRLVSVRVLIRRGVDPDDPQFTAVMEDAVTAKAEVLEAANSEEGWFDLPLRDDEDGSAISKKGPMVYSEQSPYVFTDLQRETGRNEDGSGSGTLG